MESVGELLREFWRVLVHQFRKGTSGFDVGGAVEGHEGLKWGVGADAAEVADIAVGDVKGFKEGVRSGAFDEGVEGAAIAILSWGGVPFEGSFEGVGVFFDGIVGVDGWAEHSVGEQPRDLKGVVANDFGWEAESWASSEEEIAGVFFEEIWRAGGGLAVGVRGHEGGEELFDVPIFLELEGEVIEELGVSGGDSLDSEVFFGFHDAGSEESGPVSVDGDSSGERVVGMEEPLCDAQTVLGGIFGPEGEDGGDVWGDFFGGLEV